MDVRQPWATPTLATLADISVAEGKPANSVEYTSTLLLPGPTFRMGPS